MTSPMPTAAATARAARSLSPVSSTGRSPMPTQPPRLASRGGRLDRVGDDQHAAGLRRPSPRRRRYCPAASASCGRAASPAGIGQAQCVQPARPARGHGVPVDDARDAEALRGWRSSARRAGSGRAGPGAPAAIAAAIGCSEASSTAPASRSSSPASSPGAAVTVVEAHPPGGDGAGLVQHDGVDDPGRLQHLRALDQRCRAARRGRCRPAVAVGVARPIAHGQAMISTATAAVNAAPAA